MYIQAQNNEKPLHIPQNYSGNAFRPSVNADFSIPETPTQPPAESTANQESTDLITIDAPADSESKEASADNAKDTHESVPAHKDSPLRSLLDSFMPPKVSSHKSHDRVLGDIGFEELLIIGLALLMAQSESDDSILILLLILLLYK